MLRDLYLKKILSKDFVLLEPNSLLGNFADLWTALQFHGEYRKRNKNCILTKLYSERPAENHVVAKEGSLGVSGKKGKGGGSGLTQPDSEHNKAAIPTLTRQSILVAEERFDYLSTGQSQNQNNAETGVASLSTGSSSQLPQYAPTASELLFLAVGEEPVKPNLNMVCEDLLKKPTPLATGFFEVSILSCSFAGKTA